MSDHMRQHRLGAAIRVLEVMDDFDAGMYPEPQPYFGLVTQAFVGSANAEVLMLARSCVDAERDLRDEEWDALERLLGAIPPGGNLDDIFELPAKQAVDALYAANDCRWFGV
ncbi:MAG TPA: hypothetical protein VH061_07825 [Solirubrobacteraceae bacterium]|nr:hypothetical protein [Solirubrobacteraceae bacterium]